MSLAILGIGTALPENVVTQADAVAVAQSFCCSTEEQAELLPMLYRATGIEQRHMVLSSRLVHEVLSGETQEKSSFFPEGEGDHHGPGTFERMRRYAQAAPPLAAQAAAAALENAGVTADQITHLVTVSCTGFAAPGVDISLFKNLKLSPMVQRVNVGFMGCHAAINGMRAVLGLAAADPNARVLMVCVELCSVHFHYGWDPKKVVANALFGDGAAALVGMLAPPGARELWRLESTASCLVPDSEFAMTWDVGNHGFEMTLSTKVPTLIAKHVRPFLDTWLAKHGLSVPEIKSWAIHPGGPRILSSVEKPLGLTDEDTNVSRDILRKHGNMSSPTVLFILDQLRQRRAPLPCVAVGFGPGLMAEAALFV